MKYQEIIPDKKFSDFIENFWLFENETSEDKPYTVLPDGFIDIVIYINDNEINKIKLYGVWTQQNDVVVTANSSVLGITLKPIAGEYFLKQSVGDILNSYKILEHSFLGIDELFLNNLQNFASDFLNKIDLNIKIDSRKVKLFKLLSDSSGILTVEQLSEKLIWNSRQINRYFKTKFGLSLKTYTNIIRCAATYKNIEKGNLEAISNYYDQSHFIKEIKKHTGSKPKDLHKNENDRFLQFSDLLKV